MEAKYFEFANDFIYKCKTARNKGEKLFPRLPIIRLFEIKNYLATYKFLVVFLHLRANRDYTSRGPLIRESRAMAIKELTEFINDVRSEYPTLPIVVGGIFWEERDSENLKNFAEKTNMILLSEYSEDNEYTIRIDKHNLRDYIDHFFITSDLDCKENRRSPVLPFDEIIRKFRHVVTDHLPQIILLPIKTQKRIRKERERMMYR